MDAVFAHRLGKTYRQGQSGKELKVISDLSLGIRKGDFAGLLGPNGCGKTTFLKMVAGIENPDQGSIKVCGRAAEDARIGYVPQQAESSLYPWLSCLENVAFAGVSPEKAETDAMQKLEEFGIGNYANAYPYQLSGGIRQLVSIARAALFRPDVFVLDEPLNALDYENRMLVEKTLLGLREKGATAIIVSHDIDSTVLLCDKIFVMSEKPSSIKALLPVSLPEKREIGSKFLPEFTQISKQVFNVLGGEKNAAATA